MAKFIFLLCSLIVLANITNAQQNQFHLSDEWKEYWYSGKAEVNTYSLNQARYGEMRDGNAVLIFVTEDFSKSKQVKIDNPERDRSDVQSVLKLNSTRQFNTGIYQYNIMTSVFTPTDQNTYPGVLKTTTSVQDWCGQSWMQINRSRDGYKIEGRSYFESQGDKDYTTGLNILEDELWNLVRLDPELLPVGDVKLVPGAMYCRLRHVPANAVSASLSLRAEGDRQIYRVNYPSLSRELIIEFEDKFPHKIVKWTERYPSGFNDPELMETTATLIKSSHIAYWKLNKSEDEHLRSDMGLRN